MAAWPGDSAQLFTDALPPQLLLAACTESDALAACDDNFWLPRAELEAADAREHRTLFEQVVCSLYDRVMVRLQLAGFL
jgi:hypothetical protein